MPTGQTFVPCPPGREIFTPRLRAKQSFSVPLSGEGSPEGVVPGVPGQTYTDITTNLLYQKQAGLQTLGWYLIGKVSAGGGVGGALHGSGDPASTLGSPGDTYVDDSSGALWWKASDGWHP